MREGFQRAAFVAASLGALGGAVEGVRGFEEQRLSDARQKMIESAHSKPLVEPKLDQTYDQIILDFANATMDKGICPSGPGDTCVTGADQESRDALLEQRVNELKARFPSKPALENFLFGGAEG